MKIRRDFVTNSSSSSFLLARKDELTEEQKKQIVDFVCQNMLGDRVLTPDCTEEQLSQFLEEEYIAEERSDQIRQALKEGKSIYLGVVHFDGGDDYAYILERLWEYLEENGAGNFVTIDGDLEY